MYQPWIFGAALATGTGLVALTVKLQQPPTPQALPEPTAIEAVHVLPPTPTYVAEPAPSPAVELEPIVIEGRRRPLIPRAATPPVSQTEPAAAPAEQHPCSPWRDLGPANVISAKTDGESRVRTLCY
ncbi:MAG TPA: hypothetical protein VFV94_04950 [Polyangiaceae bacterium]|jgi:hypothetical protein|nr:hypothetical protein [Polyangiaceae bacterium]